jgi:putative membrane protein
MQWRRRLGRLERSERVQAVWHALTGPLQAWSIHAAVLWVWHAPGFFQATLESEFVHTLQHLSFLLSALLFWWALIHGHTGRREFGAAVLYLFTTAVHTSILGALLTFSSTLWYPAYLGTTGAWGLAPLEDQQLGGLIMWVPAGLVYIVAGLALFAGWLRESERRVAERESRAAAQTAMDGA